MENNKKIEELINKLKNSNYFEILDKSILGDIENDFNNYLENYQRLESEDRILYFLRARIFCQKRLLQ